MTYCMFWDWCNCGYNKAAILRIVKMFQPNLVKHCTIDKLMRFAGKR